MKKNSSVFLIDDEKELLLALAAFIRRAGYEVRTASSGDEGLAEIERQRPDIVVCDVMMPPPDGFEVRARLSCNPELANIPFLFLTARTGVADKVKGLDFIEYLRFQKFLTERGKMVPSRISGNCAKHQRQIAKAIKKARIMALLPFVAE